MKSIPARSSLDLPRPSSPRGIRLGAAPQSTQHRCSPRAFGRPQELSPKSASSGPPTEGLRGDACDALRLLKVKLREMEDGTFVAKGEKASTG